VLAGHRPPIVLGRSPIAVRLVNGPPLGPGLDLAWCPSDVVWTGDPLLFYTDGLIENPRAGGPASRWEEEGLLRWLRRHSPPAALDAFADQLLQDATSERELRDDVAFMVVAGTPVAPAPVETRAQRGVLRRGRDARPDRNEIGEQV
jgi:serine phosphatase RsbU (regulator of sigma subunit)